MYVEAPIRRGPCASALNAHT